MIVYIMVYIMVYIISSVVILISACMFTYKEFQYRGVPVKVKDIIGILLFMLFPVVNSLFAFYIIFFQFLPYVAEIEVFKHDD